MLLKIRHVILASIFLINILSTDVTFTAVDHQSRLGRALKVKVTSEVLNVLLIAIDFIVAAKLKVERNIWWILTRFQGIASLLKKYLQSLRITMLQKILLGWSGHFIECMYYCFTPTREYFSLCWKGRFKAWYLQRLSGRDKLRDLALWSQTENILKSTFQTSITFAVDLIMNQNFLKICSRVHFVHICKLFK